MSEQTTAAFGSTELAKQHGGHPMNTDFDLKNASAEKTLHSGHSRSMKEGEGTAFSLVGKRTLARRAADDGANANRVTTSAVKKFAPQATPLPTLSGH